MAPTKTRLLFIAICFGVLAASCADRPRIPEQPDAAEAVASVHAFISHVQQSFNSGDFDSFMDVFADDAIQLAPAAPDAVGKDAIRAVYAGALATNDIKVEFHTAEVQVFGDLAYERGTFTIHVSKKSDGSHVADITNRHMHILRRQPNGSWKTWRMMVNSPS